METGWAIGLVIVIFVSIGVAAGVMLLLVRLVRRQRSRRLAAREKLTEKYVSLWDYNIQKRRRKHGAIDSGTDLPGSLTQLCNGAVITCPTYEQLAVKEPATPIHKSLSGSNLVGSSQPHSRSLALDQKIQKDVEKMASDGPLPKGLQKSQSLLSLFNKPRKFVKSMSTVQSPKRFLSKSSLPSQIPKYDSDGLESLTEHRYIQLAITFKEETSSLHVEIMNTTGVEPDSSIKGMLRPMNQTQTVTLPSDDGPKEKSELAYSGLKQEEIDSNHILLIFADKKDDKANGEVFINMGTLGLTNSNPIITRRQIQSKSRNRKSSTSKRLMNQALGQILLLLHYHDGALRVVIYKAEELPKTNTVLPGASEYMVKLNIFNDDESIRETRSTKFQSSRNPVWNEAFRFDMTDEELLTELRLELLLLERKRITADHYMIGHVVFHSIDATESARSQWRDCVKPYLMGVSRWQMVLPVVTYK